MEEKEKERENNHSPFSGKEEKNSLLFKMKAGLSNIFRMIGYNLKIIFGNRFIYFLISAVVLFLFIIFINLLNGEVISENGVYNILVLTGALLLFYPAAFGIQSDKDARTLEIIFGIPDYRYRVWFMRLLLIYAVTFIVLIVLSVALYFALVHFPVLKMNLQVLFPLAFLGFFTFFLSTVLRSGNGTAAVIIILGVVLLILSGNFSRSYWNIFFNPYGNPSDLSEMVWYSLEIKNRIFLGSGAIVFLLAGLMNLQKREKFLG
ncbi:MAG TPA: hypothetical protein PKH79_09635 [Prolixibacteraceae bacterium]|nr:hypothetical protein [Prolixibacteraceae bacterium]